MALTILIIDDEPDMQIYLRTLFRKAGYETQVAANGEEGLRLAQACRPDLITLDLLMPRKSGVLAYEALKADPALAAIPVVILTGLSSREGLFGSGLDGLAPPQAVFEKPIERESFLASVAKIIGAAE